MLTTNDEELARKLKALRIHGSFEKYIHQWPGMNSRLDALQAAVLDVKLDHLDAWNRARQRNAALYREALAGVVTMPAQQPYQTSHVYNQFVIRCARRDELRTFLAESGVGTEVYYPLPLHLQPALASLWVQSRRLSGERATSEGSAGAAHIRRADRGRNRHGGRTDPRILSARIRVLMRCVSLALFLVTVTSVYGGGRFAGDSANAEEAGYRRIPGREGGRRLPLAGTVRAMPRYANGAISRTCVRVRIWTGCRAEPGSWSV